MASQSDNVAPGNENKILIIIILGTLMGALDTTIVLLALPTLTSELHANLSISLWVILMYLLVTAVTTTQFGRIGDMFGRGKIFNTGFVVFTIGSALCGFSPSIGYLIGFRALQAIGGSLMQANSGAIIADTFEAHRRGKAFGFSSIGWNMGSMLGIVLGGFITTFIGWRYIFYINIPIGIVATAFGLKYVRDEKKTNAKMDLIGMLFLTSALILVSYGAIDITGTGFDAFNLSLIAIGLMLGVVFLLVEKKVAHPMLVLSAFKNRVLTFSIFASFFQSVGYLAVAFILIMYLQGVRGMNPFSASLLLIPGYIISSMTSPFMGRLSDKYGARIIATLGILLMICTIVIYTTLTPTTNLYLIVLASVISGIGASMFWPANSSAIMSNADPAHYGSISGLSRLTGNIGTLSSFVLSITVASLAIPRNVAFQIFLGSSALIGNISTEFMHGIHTTFFVSIVLLAIAALMSLIRGKEDRTRIHEQHTASVKSVSESTK